MDLLCRACFNICEPSQVSPVEGSLKEKLIFCIPELDLEVSANPMLCSSCTLALEDVNKFKTKCLDSQKKLMIILKPNGLTPTSETESTIKSTEVIAPFRLNLKKAETALKTEEEFENNSESFMGKLDPFDDFLDLLDKSKNVRDQEDSPKFNEKRSHCETGNKSFQSENVSVSRLQSPLHQVNEVDVHNDKVHKCKNCSFQTKLRISLNKHASVCKVESKDRKNTLLKKDKKKETARCQICSKKIYGNNLANHMKRCHNIDVSKQKSSKSIQNKLSTASKKLLFKIQALEENKIFQCPHENCDRAFTTLRGVRRHIVIHDSKRYVCDVCNKGVRGLKHFRAHKRSFCQTQKTDNPTSSDADDNKISENTAVAPVTISDCSSSDDEVDVITKSMTEQSQ